MHACGRAWNPEDQDYRRRAAGKKRLCGSDRNDKRDSWYHTGDDDDKRCPIERKPESIKGCRTGWDKYQPGYTGS